MKMADGGPFSEGRRWMVAYNLSIFTPSCGFVWCSTNGSERRRPAVDFTVLSLVTVRVSTSMTTAFRR